ncbi:MAG TPA: hypothetical protein VHL08_02605 [Dongiaceae bacterium]|jgi:hypothetical protein|nr:hypothetical protein [Dongiaceae bacterium]
MPVHNPLNRPWAVLKHSVPEWVGALSTIAVVRNEGDRGGIGWAGPGSGLSIGRYQNDISFSPAAAAAWRMLVTRGKENGAVTAATDPLDAARWADPQVLAAITPDIVATINRTMVPVLTSAAGQEIVAQLDRRRAEEVLAKVGALHDITMENQHRAITPIETANGAIWANRIGDAAYLAMLEDWRRLPAGAVGADFVAATLRRPYFQAHPREVVHHLESIGFAVREGVKSGLYASESIALSAMQGFDDLARRHGAAAQALLSDMHPLANGNAAEIKRGAQEADRARLGRGIV